MTRLGGNRTTWVDWVTVALVVGAVILVVLAARSCGL